MAAPDHESAETSWRRTFRLDLARSLPQGCVDTAATTFAIFLAERIFDAPAALKVLLVAAPSAGMLMSLFLVQALRRAEMSVNRAAAWIWLGGAAAFLIAAFGRDYRPTFVAGVGVGLFSLSLGLPLLSQIYRDHYPDRIRGRLFSFSGMTRGLVAAGFSVAAGAALSRHLSAWPWLLAVYAVGGVAMAAVVMRMPTVRLERSRRVRLFAAFRHVRADRPFRKLLIVWMFLGLGNLLSVALFVEYLVNPIYGFGYDAARVGWVTTTIPMLAFVASVVLWGILFDRLNFYLLRVAINGCFIAGIALYYFGESYGALCVGIGIHGIARAGGDVAWSLWVTKFASAGRVAEYMSVHTFLTGIRGMMAPVLAFSLAGSIGPTAMATLGIALIVAATLMIAPEVRLGAARRKSYAVANRPLR